MAVGRDSTETRVMSLPGSLVKATWLIPDSEAIMVSLAVISASIPLSGLSWLEKLTQMDQI